MAVIVQSDAGDVDGANAYISVAEFKAYHDTRGNDYSAKTDNQIGYAIVKATDYLDARFPFRGIKLTEDQTTMWPRQANQSSGVRFFDIQFPPPDIILPFAQVIYLRDNGGQELSGIPQVIKNVTAEYAFRALTISLFQDAPAPEGGRAIQSTSVRVDVIEQSITYEPGAYGLNGSFVMPAYPQADLMLTRAGIVAAGRELTR